MGATKSFVDALFSNDNFYDLSEREFSPFSRFCSDNDISFSVCPKGIGYRVFIESTSAEQLNLVEEYMDSKPFLVEAAKIATIPQLDKRLRKSIDDYCSYHFGVKPLDYSCTLLCKEDNDSVTFEFSSDLNYDDSSDLAEQLTSVINDLGYPESFFSRDDAGKWICIIFK